MMHHKTENRVISNQNYENNVDILSKLASSGLEKVQGSITSLVSPKSVAFGSTFHSPLNSHLLRDSSRRSSVVGLSENQEKNAGNKCSCGRCKHPKFVLDDGSIDIASWRNSCGIKRTGGGYIIDEAKYREIFEPTKDPSRCPINKRDIQNPGRKNIKANANCSIKLNADSTYSSSVDVQKSQGSKLFENENGQKLQSPSKRSLSAQNSISTATLSPSLQIKRHKGFDEKIHPHKDIIIETQFDAHMQSRPPRKPSTLLTDLSRKNPSKEKPLGGWNSISFASPPKSHLATAFQTSDSTTKSSLSPPMIDSSNRIAHDATSAAVALLTSSFSSLDSTLTSYTGPPLTKAERAQRRLAKLLNIHAVPVHPSGLTPIMKSATISRSEFFESQNWESNESVDVARPKTEKRRLESYSIEESYINTDEKVPQTSFNTDNNTVQIDNTGRGSFLQTNEYATIAVKNQERALSSPTKGLSKLLSTHLCETVTTQFIAAVKAVTESIQDQGEDQLMLPTQDIRGDDDFMHERSLDKESTPVSKFSGVNGSSVLEIHELSMIIHNEDTIGIDIDVTKLNSTHFPPSKPNSNCDSDPLVDSLVKDDVIVETMKIDPAFEPKSPDQKSNKNINYTLSTLSPLPRSASFCDRHLDFDADLEHSSVGPFTGKYCTEMALVDFDQLNQLAPKVCGYADVEKHPGAGIQLVSRHNEENLECGIKEESVPLFSPMSERKSLITTTSSPLSLTLSTKMLNIMAQPVASPGTLEGVHKSFSPSVHHNQEEKLPSPFKSDNINSDPCSVSRLNTSDHIEQCSSIQHASATDNNVMLSHDTLSSNVVNMTQRRMQWMTAIPKPNSQELDKERSACVQKYSENLLDSLDEDSVDLLDFSLEYPQLKNLPQRVSIKSTKQCGTFLSKYTIYILRVEGLQGRNSSRLVEKRYSDILALWKSLTTSIQISQSGADLHTSIILSNSSIKNMTSQLSNDVSCVVSQFLSFKFPEKVAFGSTNVDVVNRRRSALTNFFNLLCATGLINSYIVRSFFSYT